MRVGELTLELLTRKLEQGQKRTRAQARLSFIHVFPAETNLFVGSLLLDLVADRRAVARTVIVDDIPRADLRRPRSLRRADRLKFFMAVAIAALGLLSADGDVVCAGRAACERNQKNQQRSSRRETDHKRPFCSGRYSVEVSHAPSELSIAGQVRPYRSRR